mmetsp:Transcript_453/g.1130  ORF Transcript_453/g.1130 Transcript_453/m.1130 type:complete len:295 (-) Transcript_453:1793-2677(-)
MSVGCHNLEVRRQPCLHVVSVQDGIPCRVRDATDAQHGAEHPRDAGDACLPPRCRGHGAQVATRGGLHNGVARQVRGEVLPHANRAKAWPTTTVWDAESLVQVEVTDIRANHARGGEAELGVHVRAIHVDLAAVVMNDLADLLDVVFKERACRRIGDHEGRQVILVFLAELLELTEVHAFGVINPLDLHVAHGRGGRVGAVRRPRDDADVAVALPLGLQVLADYEQPGILARGPARWLQGAGIKARAADEVLLQRLQELTVPCGLAVRCEGVHLGDLWPAAGRQRGDGVQLHGA